MRINSRAQLVVAAALWFVAIGLLGWGLWPAGRETRTLNVDLSDSTPPAFLASAGPLFGGAADHARYSIALEYPQRLRVGDSDLVHLRIDPALGPPTGQLPSPSDGKPAPGPRGGEGASAALAIQARLELSASTVTPAGDVTSPWSPNEGASFVWRIRSADGVPSRGTAWAFLIPIGSGRLAEERMAISAQPVAISTSTLLGVNGPAARGIGSVLLVLGAVLGLPGLDRLLIPAIRVPRARPR